MTAPQGATALSLCQQIERGDPRALGILLRLFAGAIAGASNGGFVYESSVDNLTAHAGGGQASALQLTAELNRVSTVATIGDSVKLPPSFPGMTIILENAGANAMQVFGAGTDTINGVVTATGVSQMAGSVVIYTCYTSGAWFANGLGTGYAGSLETMSYATGITAHAGGGQASAVALAAMQNVITVCATGGDSVVLPAAMPGMQITVINNGAASCNVFAPTGGYMNGTLNGSAAVTNATVILFFGSAAGYWISK